MDATSAPSTISSTRLRALDLLRLMDPEVTADRSKVHLATWNGEEDPLDVYLQGRFDEWQKWQYRRNFGRGFVISLIKMSGVNRWLFAGVHNSNGCEAPNERGLHYYHLHERPGCAELHGRLVIEFARSGRQSYLNADGWVDRMYVGEILPKKLSIEAFPGFRAVNIPKAHLDLVVAQSSESWRSALSSVAGVYLISDTTTGALYVGSASGEGGIWQRWCCYAATGHGGNVELRALLEREGAQRAAAFRYSVLEIADIHAADVDVLTRESHWKRVLRSRDYGLNGN